MPAPVLILVGVALLAGVGLGILTVLIVGIRRGDRRHLAKTAASRSDAFARRMLVGVRYPNENNEGDDQ